MARATTLVQLNSKQHPRILAKQNFSLPLRRFLSIRHFNMLLEHCLTWCRYEFDDRYFLQCPRQLNCEMLMSAIICRSASATTLHASIDYNQTWIAIAGSQMPALLALDEVTHNQVIRLPRIPSPKMTPAFEAA